MASQSPKRRNLRYALITLGIAVIVGIISALTGLHTQSRVSEAELIAELNNTLIDHQVIRSEALIERVDGSYYSTTYEGWYTYTTTDESGVIVEQRLGGLLRGSLVQIVVINDSASADESIPRIEFTTCRATAIDPTLPSYTGKFHEWDPRKTEDTGNWFFGPTRHAICQDEIRIYVPNGKVLP